MPDGNQDIDVRAIREALGITQEEVAREIGVSFAAVSRRETGHWTPSPLGRRRLEELRDGLGARGAADVEKRSGEDNGR